MRLYSKPYMRGEEPLEVVDAVLDSTEGYFVSPGGFGEPSPEQIDFRPQCLGFSFAVAKPFSLV